MSAQVLVTLEYGTLRLPNTDYGKDNVCPYSVFRIPYSVFRIPYSVFRIPYSVFMFFPRT
ncbi:hypothetical protein [Vibrio sp.]|uniref:hypothetical protein n=1 Tax=Vibrio sp. TaxID=678 RepID=UPI003AA9CF42